MYNNFEGSWEEHNEEFSYEPPDKRPEQWDNEELTELYDRVVSKNTTWICDHCSQPFQTLEKVRSHVKSDHSEHLLEKYAPDPETEEDDEQDIEDEAERVSTRMKEIQNHGLDEFE